MTTMPMHQRPKTLTLQKHKDNQKISRIRRQRGYHWEDTIVKRFNAASGWNAFRLGSPSVALPDILAVSTRDNSLFVIEAKSGTAVTLHVPSDQIERCLRWTDTFELYRFRTIILAFKFLSKKRIGTGVYRSRQLREFFKVWDPRRQLSDCICTYEGKTYAYDGGRGQQIGLADHKMPFESRHRLP